MRAKNKSLTAQLAWRLIGLQILIILGVLFGISYIVYGASVSYISESVPNTILEAVGVDTDGKLVLTADEKFQALRRARPALWFAVENMQGRRLQYGEVPDIYRPLMASLSRLRPSEIHDD